MSNRASNWRFPPDLFMLSVIPVLAVAFLASLAIKLLQLDGYTWIWSIGIALIIAICGATLILKAKLPLLREKRFFTFGCSSIPHPLKKVYLLGVWLTVIGCFLAALLLIGAHLK